ncbi:hypothetical protein D3C71_998830 [compost metagenome]
MPGGIVKTSEDPPLAKLADTQWIGLWHHGDSALESAFGLGHRKALHQQMQNQHPGDFIGMHAGLQMHLRPSAGAFETPGTDLHRTAIVVANLERNILRHTLVLPS